MKLYVCLKYSREWILVVKFSKYYLETNQNDCFKLDYYLVITNNISMT